MCPQYPNCDENSRFGTKVAILGTKFDVFGTFGKSCCDEKRQKYALFWGENSLNNELLSNDCAATDELHGIKST